MSAVIEVGKRLRAARANQGRVIEEIATATGLSRAYISQVETGKASPSLLTLQKLSNALNIPISSLFAEEHGPSGCTVIRADERPLMQYGTPDAPRAMRKMIHFLSAPNRPLEMVMLELPAGAAAIDHTHTHEGEEVFYVLEGRIQAVHGDREFVLEPGDSLHWEAQTPHMISNIADSPAKVMVARTPPGMIDLKLSDDGTIGKS